MPRPDPKFTPGPWEARYDDRVIAHIYARKGQPYAQRANQCLIAAAPDLYYALRAFDERGYTQAVGDLIKRALARADGAGQ